MEFFLVSFLLFDMISCQVLQSVMVDRKDINLNLSDRKEIAMELQNYSMLQIAHPCTHTIGQTFTANKMYGCDGQYTYKTFRGGCSPGWRVATAEDYVTYGGKTVRPNKKRWIDVAWDSSGKQTSLDNYVGYWYRWSQAKDNLYTTQAFYLSTTAYTEDKYDQHREAFLDFADVHLGKAFGTACGSFPAGGPARLYCKMEKRDTFGVICFKECQDCQRVQMDTSCESRRTDHLETSASKETYVYSESSGSVYDEASKSMSNSDSYAMSGEVSGGFGGFSASVKASYSEANSASSATSRASSIMSLNITESQSKVTNKTIYQAGKSQLLLKIVRRIIINGQSFDEIDVEHIDSIPKDSDLPVAKIEERCRAKMIFDRYPEDKIVCQGGHCRYNSRSMLFCKHAISKSMPPC